MTNPQPQQERGLYETAPFPVGAAVATPRLQGDEAYRTTTLRQFNQYTVEYEMKWNVVQKARGVWDFAAVDYCLSIGRTHNKRLFGHTLVWSKAVPDWAWKLPRAEFEQATLDFIWALVTRCKGAVVGWDMLNEVLDDDGNLKRDGLWGVFGSDAALLNFLARCCFTARDADPSARLFINDFDMELNTTKLRGALRLAAQLQQRGVVLHGVGFQTHLSIEPSVVASLDSLQARFHIVANAGLSVHVSELDVSLNPRRLQPFVLTSDALQQQRSIVRRVVQAFMSLPAASRFAVTTWGVHDASSWLRTEPNVARLDYPLLFDDAFAPKPAWTGFTEGARLLP
jgi:endo-1,4-beta-xylanase